MASICPHHPSLPHMPNTLSSTPPLFYSTHHSKYITNNPILSIKHYPRQESFIPTRYIHKLEKENSKRMSQCICSFTPPSPSISKFISRHPYLNLLEAHCHTFHDLTKIHAHLIKTGLVRHPLAASRLLAVCAPIHTPYAASIFRRIHNPNLFAWNTIIRSFCQSSSPSVAIQLFIEMLTTTSVCPNHLTYPSVFKAYAQLGLAGDGVQPHALVVKLGLDLDPYIRNSLIHMYASCGMMEDAGKLFDDRNLDLVAWNSMIMGFAKCGDVEESWLLFSRMPRRNEVSWSAMISSLVRNGQQSKALSLFYRMEEEGIQPTEFAVVSALNACAQLGSLEQGKQIHHNAMLPSHNVIGATAVINMYTKCGDVEAARHVFNAVCSGTALPCWNAMILGLAINGQPDAAFAMFSQLLSHLRPDSVTFVAVLMACSHACRVDKAREYFRAMMEAYGIQPEIEHYGCLVDALGRAGLVKEAAEVIRNMPMRPDAAVWGSLLSSCSYCDNVEVAEWAAWNLTALDPDDTSSHVLMSRAYASSGHLEMAMQERRLMKTKKMKKQAGCSSIEVNGEFHEFVAAGMSVNVH